MWEAFRQRLTLPPSRQAAGRQGAPLHGRDDVPRDEDVLRGGAGGGGAEGAGL